MEGYRGVVIRQGEMEMEGFTVREPAEDELAIRTRKTLISPGTERAFFLGLPNAEPRYPIYPGYNLVGDVIAMGSAVTDFQLGDRVVCTASHASHVVVKAQRCHPVPSDLIDNEAVFFQLLTIAMQGVRKSGLEIGEAIAIIGAGPIGLLALQVARTAGAMLVVVIDRDEQRLVLAQQIGSDITLTTSDDLSARLNAAALDFKIGASSHNNSP